MNDLDLALDSMLPHLTKEELIELVKILIQEGLHSSGRKKGSKNKEA